MRLAPELWGSHVRVIDLQRNFGQTAAMQAGIDAARGEVIVTMDGDLQNAPVDIPRLVKRLLEEDLDLVAGWRKDRKDNLIHKIPSHITNRLIGRITEVGRRGGGGGRGGGRAGGGGGGRRGGGGRPGI